MCGTENINNDLYEKTNELNKLNFQIVQLNECKVMLEKELKEIKCGPNDFQKKIKEKYNFVYYIFYTSYLYIIWHFIKSFSCFFIKVKKK